MSERDSKRVKAVFVQAADLPEKERGAFLDAACRGEPALRAEVDSLLSYDSSFETGERDDRFLQSPLVVSDEGTQRVNEALRILDPIDREVLALRHFQKLGRAKRLRHSESVRRTLRNGISAPSNSSKIYLQRCPAAPNNSEVISLSPCTHA